jgi:hypothetical protein
MQDDSPFFCLSIIIRRRVVTVEFIDNSGNPRVYLGVYMGWIYAHLQSQLPRDTYYLY